MLFLHCPDLSCITISTQHELSALVQFGHLGLCTGTVVAWCTGITLVMAADFCKTGILEAQA